jgi:uncharacterized membrane protein YeaQ/YmgE (transglycosylase-associated protein family)
LLVSHLGVTGSDATKQDKKGSFYKIGIIGMLLTQLHLKRQGVNGKAQQQSKILAHIGSRMVLKRQKRVKGNINP